MNAPPDAAVMPRLPPAAPRAVPEPPAAPQPLAAAATPATEAVPQQPARRPRRALGLVLTAVCSLFALALLATGVYATYLIAWGAKDVSSDRELPVFSVAPPAYGTVHVLVDQSGSDAQAYQVIANGDASVRYFAWTAASFTNADGLGVMDPNGLYFLAAGETTWRLVDRAPAALMASQTFMAKVLTFADCVPDTARPYTEVLSHSEVAIDGRVLQRYEMRMEIGRWSSNKPSAFEAWALHLDLEPTIGEFTEFTVFVDQSGVVWQLEIGDADRLTVTLRSFSPEVFAPQLPLVYTDETNGGVLVGG